MSELLKERKKERKKDFFQNVTQVARRKKASAPNKSQTYDLLGISPDAQPLCCRRLVGAKTIKLVSYCQHPAYCQDWNAVVQ